MNKNQMKKTHKINDKVSITRTNKQYFYIMNGGDWKVSTELAEDPNYSQYDEIQELLGNKNNKPKRQHKTQQIRNKKQTKQYTKLKNLFSNNFKEVVHNE